MANFNLGLEIIKPECQNNPIDETILHEMMTEIELELDQSSFQEEYP